MIKGKIKQVLLILSLLVFGYSQSIGQQSCSELFSQNYSGCEDAHFRSLAVATAGLTICLAGYASSPLIVPGIAACSANYYAGVAVADMNFDYCVEMAGQWFFSCVEW